MKTSLWSLIVAFGLASITFCQDNLKPKTNDILIVADPTQPPYC